MHHAKSKLTEKHWQHLFGILMDQHLDFIILPSHIGSIWDNILQRPLGTHPDSPRQVRTNGKSQYMHHGKSKLTEALAK
jgi:hypothetical protein